MLKSWLYNILGIVVGLALGCVIVATFIIAADMRGWWWLASWFIALILIVSLGVALYDRYG